MRLVCLPRILCVAAIIATGGCVAKVQEATEAVVDVFNTAPAYRFSEEKSTLAYCEKQLAPDYEVERGSAGFTDFYKAVRIRRTSDRKIVYSVDDGHDECVFARRDKTLYIAEHHAIATGCRVDAVDLDTGKRLWSTQLEGIGPTGHSEYRNQVNIELDGNGVVVFGNESHGCYVEVLNVRTGTQVAHRKLPSEYEMSHRK